MVGSGRFLLPPFLRVYVQRLIQQSACRIDMPDRSVRKQGRYYTSGRVGGIMPHSRRLRTPRVLVMGMTSKNPDVMASR